MITLFPPPRGDAFADGRRHLLDEGAERFPVRLRPQHESGEADVEREVSEHLDPVLGRANDLPVDVVGLRVGRRDRT